MNRPLVSVFFASSELFVTVGTYLLLGAALVFGLILCKVSVDLHQGFWSDRFRGSAVAAIVSAFGAAGMFAVGFHRSARDRRAKFWFPLAMNVLVVLVCLFLSEISLRAVAKPDPFGMRVGPTTLVPFEWKKFAAMNRTLLERSRSNTAFYIEDPILGWTIGRAREGNDGMYKSSAEGLRSMVRGAALNSVKPRHRIALFGDSFTFAYDVPFEQSWGHFLELNLDAETQVLNFGVDGYGIDQAYLRFKREVPKWAPSVSILAFIQDDLYRNVSVYPFFRGWERPFSKPRFIVNGAKLESLNVPSLPPDAIFATASIRDLPLVDYDINFDSYWWEPRTLYSSYLVRFMATKFPRWSLRNAHTSDDVAAQLGSRLIEEFVESARSEKTVGIVVYLPSRNDFASTGPVLAEKVRQTLAVKGIEVRNMTSCLTGKVPLARLFVEGKPHYSGEGNAALAMCLKPLVAAYLN